MNRNLWRIKSNLLFFGILLFVISCQKDPNTIIINFNDVSALNRSLEDCPLVSCEEESEVTAEIVARRDHVDQNTELANYFQQVFERNPLINTIICDREVDDYYMGMIEIAPKEAICIKGFPSTDALLADRCLLDPVVQISQPRVLRTNGATSRRSLTSLYNALCRFCGQ